MRRLRHVDPQVNMASHVLEMTAWRHGAVLARRYFADDPATPERFPCAQFVPATKTPVGTLCFTSSTASAVLEVIGMLPSRWNGLIRPAPLFRRHLGAFGMSAGHRVHVVGDLTPIGLLSFVSVLAGGLDAERPRWRPHVEYRGISDGWLGRRDVSRHAFGPLPHSSELLGWLGALDVDWPSILGKRCHQLLFSQQRCLTLHAVVDGMSPSHKRRLGRRLLRR